MLAQEGRTGTGESERRDIHTTSRVSTSASVWARANDTRVSSTTFHQSTAPQVTSISSLSRADNRLSRRYLPSPEMLERRNRII
ncbi:MAG: hypothetical protein LW693_09575 [Saprospiraceae bacterium]|nr:hypothetical protein [Saprospiraceae bacterium]